MNNQKWITTWAYAQRNTRYTYWENQNSFKLAVPNNIGGEAIRLKLSNMYGEKPARIANARCVGRSFTFDGELSCAVGFGQSVYSDALPATVCAGRPIGVEVSFATFENPMSGNTFSPGVAMILQCVEALTADNPQVIAVLGDSIAHQGYWVKPFVERLYSNYPGQVAAFEVGIDGNRLLRDSGMFFQTLGHAGARRFAHDILSLQGLTHMIFALGINDLGMPGTEGVGMEELPTVDEYKAAATQIVEKLHEKGAKAIGVTITPRHWPNPGADKRESLRKQINEWILSGGTFDHAIDFSSALERGGKPCQDFYLEDMFHINEKGGQAMLSCIPMRIFDI